MARIIETVAEHDDDLSGIVAGVMTGWSLGNTVVQRRRTACDRPIDGLLEQSGIVGVVLKKLDARIECHNECFIFTASQRGREKFRCRLPFESKFVSDASARIDD